MSTPSTPSNPAHNTDPADPRRRSKRSAGQFEYECLACGATQYPPGGGYKGARHRIHCEECGDITDHERTDHDGRAARPAQAEQERAEANGWRVNDDGNLVIGGDAD